jgi:hypothetical protein
MLSKSWRATKSTKLDQVPALTGCRFIGNFTSDQQQYQALMDSGLK